MLGGVVCVCLRPTGKPVDGWERLESIEVVLLLHPTRGHRVCCCVVGVALDREGVVRG